MSDELNTTAGAPGDDGSCATRNAHAAAAGVPSAAAICPAHTTVTDRLLNELDGLYADRRQAEEVLDKIEADIAALRRELSLMGVEDV